MEDEKHEKTSKRKRCVPKEGPARNDENQVVIEMIEQQKPAKPAVGANNGNAQLENEIFEQMPPLFKSLVEFMRKTNQAVGGTVNQPQEQEVRTI